MTQEDVKTDQDNNRSDPRELVDQYYSVEFSIQGLELVYQFKIWNLSQKGMCVLVREDSAILEHVKVGERLKMKYYPTDLLGPVEHLETEVRHITKDDEGRFKGHYMLGLLILEKTGTK